MAKRTLLIGAALASLVANGALAQTRDDGSGFSDMAQPRYSSAQTGDDASSGSTGDNLGNHRAADDLDMRGNAIYNLGAPIDPSDAATMEYVDDHRDHLGNHTAEEHLKMENFEIIGLGSPTTKDSAATKSYVDNHRDHLGNHIAEMDLDMSDYRITDLADPQENSDAATKSYVDNHRDHLGNHIAEMDLNMMFNRILDIPDLEADADGNFPDGAGHFAINKNYADDMIDGVNTRIDTTNTEIDRTNTRVDQVLNTRITPGTGIRGGGRLNGDVTLSFDVPWGDNRYARSSQIITTGDGLWGGGRIGSGLELKVDPSVVRTHGNQRVNGTKTINSIRSYSNGNHPTGGNRFGRAWSQGIELHGGSAGNILSSISTGTNPKNFKIMTWSGDGAQQFIFHRDGKFEANELLLQYDGSYHTPSIAFDSDRDTGLHRDSNGGVTITDNSSKVAIFHNNKIQAEERLYAEEGISLGGSIDVNRNTIYGVKDPVNGDHAVNKNYLENRIQYARNNPRISYNRVNAGWGLTGGGRMNSDTSIHLAPDQRGRRAGDSSRGVMRYNGRNRLSGAFYSGGSNPFHSERLNYNGHLHATRFYGKMYLYFSDATLKKDVESIESESALSDILDIRPVSYTWKESDERAVGVIAQEVEEIFPTAVKTGEDGLKSVDYLQLVAPAIGAIQELNAEVETLEKRVAELEAERETLIRMQARMARMAERMEAVERAANTDAAPGTGLREAAMR